MSRSQNQITTKYRPATFSEIRGQDHVVVPLRRQVSKGEVHPAFLLYGERGTGKTTTGRVLAAALNCPERSDKGEPCGSCESCRAIREGHASFDVLEVNGADKRGMDDARELCERLHYAASSAERWRVVIMDECHMLTREAWNILLKTVEEPPPRVVFVFATTEREKVPAAIQSRAQVYELKLQGVDDIAKHLKVTSEKEGISIADDALFAVAKSAKGSYRDGLTKLGQVAAAAEDGTISQADVRSILGLPSEDVLVACVRVLLERDDARIGGMFKTLKTERLLTYPEQIFAGIIDVLRDLRRVQLGDEAESVSGNLRPILKKLSQQYESSDVTALMLLAAGYTSRIYAADDQLLQLEAFFFESLSIPKRQS